MRPIFNTPLKREQATPSQLIHLTTLQILKGLPPRNDIEASGLEKERKQRYSLPPSLPHFRGVLHFVARLVACMEEQCARVLEHYFWDLRGGGLDEVCYEEGFAALVQHCYIFK